MKKHLLFIASLLLSLSALAQFRVGGSVVDSEGAPVASAAVVAADAASGAFLQHDITTPEGRFSLMVKGNIRLFVSSLGYEQYESGIISIEGDAVLPAIVLAADDIVIDDVVVVGERQSPAIRTENGKLIFTPNNSSTLAGSSALEVLKRTPGVFVDGENNISIGGRGSVLVILNGRQTYMQRDELVALLKATPSAAVTSVEVINSPSARYDAEGSGGIININMNRRSTDGFFLSLNNGLSYWENLRENTELSVSYANEKFNLTANYNHAFGHYNMDYGMHRFQDGREYWSPTDDTEKRKTIAGNIAAEYAFNDRHTLGGRVDVNTLFGPGWTSTMTEIRDAATGNLEQTLYGSNDYYSQKGNRYGANLYYTARPREGESYTVDLNYAWFDGGSGNMQPNKYVAADGTVLQDNLYKSVNSRNIHIYAVAFDQQHQLWSGELKSGAKYSSVNADNGFRFYDATDGAEVVDEKQSNDFRYRERIAAAYLLYSRSIGERLSLEAGVRGEYTLSDGLLRTIGGAGDEDNSRNYFNIFPSLGLNWQVGEGHTLAFNYASRIDRPAYQDLNPFEYLLDELSSWKGNPFLKPQKTHQTTLSYTRKRTVLTASYSYMKDFKTQITDTVASGKVVMTPRNIGRQQRVSLNLYQGVNVTRWWEMNLNATVYYLTKNVVFDELRRFDLDGFAGIFSVQNSFRLPWELRMELNGQYVTRRPGASNEILKSTGYVDLGLSRTFGRNDSWIISLAVSDLFHTIRWDNYSSFEGFRLWQWGNSETRQVKLNVTFRFGRRKEGQHKSNFDEIERL